MKRSDADRVRAALYHIQRIEKYEANPIDEERQIDSISMRLSSVLEELSHLPTGLLDDLFDGKWSEAWGMRNRIAHSYLGVDDDIIVQTVRNRIPGLRANLERWLTEHPE